MEQSERWLVSLEAVVRNLYFLKNILISEEKGRGREK